MSAAHGRRHLMIIGILGLVRCAFPNAHVLAQEAAIAAAPDSSIATGDRIRITTSASPKPMVGWVDAVDPGEIRLVGEDGQSVDTVSFEDVLRLERSRVRRSTWQRAGPGAVAGGFLGAIIGTAITEEQRCEANSFLCIDLPEKAFAGFGGAAIGLLAGGLISAVLIPGESWEDASLPSMTAGADADGGGFLAVRIPLGSGRRP